MLPRLDGTLDTVIERRKSAAVGLRTVVGALRFREDFRLSKKALVIPKTEVLLSESAGVFSVVVQYRFVSFRH